MLYELNGSKVLQCGLRTMGILNDPTNLFTNIYLEFASYLGWK